MILFLPSSILVLMFPKATEMSILNKNTLNLLNYSLIGTALISGTASLILIINPFIVEIIFGHSYSDAYAIIPTYSAMMFLFTLVYAIAYYCLAMNYLNYVYIILLFTMAEICLISIAHGSLLQMVWILLIANLALFIISYVYVFYANRSKRIHKSVLKNHFS